MPVVVTDRTGGKLHGGTVLDAHTGHLGEHLSTEEFLFLGNGATGQNSPVESGCSVWVEICGHGRWVTLIGSGSPHGLEEGAAVAQSVEVALPGADVFAGNLA